MWKICQVLNLANLKASSHLRSSHATLNGAHSEIRNSQRPDLRWGTNCAGECLHWAAFSYLQDSCFTAAQLLCGQSALAMHTATMSLCLIKSWHSPNHFAIQTSWLSVRLLYAWASFAQYKEVSFLGTAAGWFRLLLISQWCCSDPH